MSAEPLLWENAVAAARVVAVDPTGVGGVAVRASAGPVRDAWLSILKDLLPASSSMRRLPLHISDGRLLGGLDLAATLQAGRPMTERGILAESDGGVLVIAMAERMSASTAVRIANVLDRGEVVMERDGLGFRQPARFGIVALDEGIGSEETMPQGLHDRLGLHIDLTSLGHRDITEPINAQFDLDPSHIVEARGCLSSVSVADECLELLCGTAMALGVFSMRAPLLALKAAKAAAALSLRTDVTADDVSLAAQLVLAPRATMIPAEETDRDPAEADPDPADHDNDQDDDRQSTSSIPEDMILEAAQAAIPPNLLSRLKTGESGRSKGTAGRADAFQRTRNRGRPIGVTTGDPRSGARLNIIETLRAAAPWQTLRRREAAGHPLERQNDAPIDVRRSDFRVTRFKERSQTTTIFVVDASGSAALHRLAEAKGAIEILLADCYVRRDQVSVVAFRGHAAECLLPPTRSLARAKRSLAGLPGGGGTPLAAGIDTAVTLALGVRAKGGTPSVVLLTDGRANVARDGTPGRPVAESDALESAHVMKALGLNAIFIDTATRPQPRAERLAEAMNALYLPLPHADAAAISYAVQHSGQANSTTRTQPAGLSAGHG